LGSSGLTKVRPSLCAAIHSSFARIHQRELADDRRRSSKHAVGVGGEIPLGQKIEAVEGIVPIRWGSARVKMPWASTAPMCEKSSDLVIAEAVGLTVPPSILLRADRVIE
jgi:hypothetical protein